MIQHLNELNTTWLTDVLKTSGALIQGAVNAYTLVSSDKRELSSNARLHIQYADNSTGELPQHLFLKLVKINLEDEFFGPSEVNYYIRDYVDLKDAPIPRAYSAAFSEAQSCYYILMDDVTQSHIEAYQRPHNPEDGLALAEALARLHAHWWDAEKLKADDEAIPDAQAIMRFVDVARSGAGHIIEACSHELKPHWPAAIFDLYEKHPRLMIERTEDPRGFTLIHGDVNGGNVFVPRDGQRPVFIVDRQPFDWSLRTWLGVYDLSYAIVHKWDPALRRQHEQQILQHYHQELQHHGVQDYSWEQLYLDYRICAVMSIYVACEWCRGAYHAHTKQYWMPMLQKAMTAFDELDCRNLW